MSIIKKHIYNLNEVALNILPSPLVADLTK